MSGQHIPRQQLTQSEFALEQTVDSFGNLLFQLEELHLTHTYGVVFRFCELEIVRFLALGYLITGTLQFEQFSKEWLFNREVWFSFISETDFGESSTRSVLKEGQEVESFFDRWQ